MEKKKQNKNPKGSMVDQTHFGKSCCFVLEDTAPQKKASTIQLSTTLSQNDTFF